ncbi:mechanosensitive ion channel family protein [Pseudopedobacter beijingensis]|uniref:Mechanosensitive ion channel family protein n=1 Tax=Pseudopedobacter beijingensis TaxID=1207056 RepID=A0ABW4IDM4_9SPHI
MNNETLTYLQTIEQFLVTKGTEIGIAIIKATLIWFIGKQIIKLINKAFSAIITKNKVDISLQFFLKSIVHNALTVLLIMTVLTTLGVEMTSFFALLGAAGLAVGMALQGSLANFAGGVLILLLKPFKVGDSIESKGNAGTVSEIQIFHTVIKTFDLKTVIIPNGALYNDVIVNNSIEPARKVQWTFNINYGDDIDLARKTIEEVIFSDKRVIDKKDPFIIISSVSNAGIQFNVRALVKNADFTNVESEKKEEMKLAFDKAGIAKPSTHTNIHLYKKDEA